MRKILKSRIYLFFALFFYFTSTPTLQAEPLYPLGNGQSTINAEMSISTNQDTAKNGSQTTFSFLHGLNNAATIGLNYRTLKFEGGKKESSSFSLILDFGARRYYDGKASYYGKKFHGKKTAIGQVYNMYGISAAHKALPLGSRAKVTNKENEKSVVVEINDRGPYVKGRELDLSYGAARKIGLDKKGIGEVEIESLRFANFSLIGGGRHTNSNINSKESSYESIFYGLGADFRLESALKAYAYSTIDSHSSFIEYEGGLLIDLPGSLKAGVNYGKHLETFEGLGVFLQYKF